MSSTRRSRATTPERRPFRQAAARTDLRRRAGLALFTDVDGCVLDARTYRPGPARAVLRLLARRGIPVVFCTSKTRLEVRSLVEMLGLRVPAVIESGAAILVPAGMLPAAEGAGRETPDGRLFALAPPIAEVRSGLAEIRRLMGGGGIVGFGDLTAPQVARLTGLEPAAARRARRREFDEPFLFLADPRPNRPAIRRVLRSRGLAITRGGRFHHLHGATDKGRALRLVRRWLEAERGGKLCTIALGDSAHDLPFMATADLAVIVPRPDGSIDPLLGRRLPRARRAPAPGPRGWSAAVRQVLAGG